MIPRMPLDKANLVFFKSVLTEGLQAKALQISK